MTDNFQYNCNKIEETKKRSVYEKLLRNTKVGQL